MPFKLTGFGLLALTALALPAMAQSNSTTGQSQPGATQPGGTIPGAVAPSTGLQRMGQTQAMFITQENPGTWRASKLVGVNIYGSNNESIGEVNEVLIERSGQVAGVVIGVGGFLGIGEKNVAIPFDQVEWVANGSGSASGSMTGRGGTGGGSAANQLGTTGSAGSSMNDDTTGSLAGSGTGSGSRAGVATRGYPDHGVLHMTKADLQNAPNFVWPESWTR